MMALPATALKSTSGKFLSWCRPERKLRHF